MRTIRNTQRTAWRTGIGGLGAKLNGFDALAPSGLLLTTLSDTSIKLDWTNNSLNAEGVSIERSADGVTYAEIDTVLADVTTFTDTGLTAGTLYYYRIRAYKVAVYSAYSEAIVHSLYLPTKLVLTPAPYVEEMDATTGWSVSQAGATMALNTTQKKSGTGSIKVLTSSGGAGRITKTVSWNLPDGKSIRFYVYPHSDSETFSGFTLYAGSNDFNDYFYCSVTGNTNTLKQGEWTMFWMDNDAVSDWVIGGGSPSWNNITRFAIHMNGKAGQIRECSFDLLIANEVRRPCVLLTFDDGHISHFSKAFPLIAAKKMVATSYIVSDFIDTSEHMSSSQLIELNANGWDISNHSKDHSYLNLLTEQQVVDNLTACKTALDNLGLSRASNHVAYPFGNFSGNVLPAMIAFNGKTGRAVNHNGYGLYEQGLYNLGFPLRINSITPTNTTTLQEAKTYIDNCISLNVSCIFYFHEIVDENANTTMKWLTSQLSDLLDYIESLGLQTLTIDEYYRLNSNAITVNHK